ncbi:MAG: hypothetical protein DMG82_10615 [Acidobacteria bacterium]|nr:MAG: hypothetical protein DMG82_10615 [Acidobacteriota bacterium]
MLEAAEAMFTEDWEPHFCFVNYFCEQESMGVAAAASMLRVLIGSKSVSHPHFQTDHRDLQGCALNSCQQMPGSRIVRGS